MVYQFYLKETWAMVDAFVRFLETLKSVRHIGIDYQLNDVHLPNGFVNVLCSEDDYKEAFYWLKHRDIRAHIVRTPLKDYNMSRRISK